MDAIRDGRACYISDNGQVDSSKTANGVDEQSFRVGQQLDTLNGTARAHSLIIRNGGKLLTESQVIKILEPSGVAVRNMPRRNRKKINND